MLAQKFLFGFALTVALSALPACMPKVMAQGAAASEGKAAMALYTNKQYAAAADAFERVIAKQPTATFCYYAALANRSARRDSRARQLFEYTIHNFPGTTEANYSMQVLGAGGATPAAAQTATAKSNDDDELPESVRTLIPPEMQDLMKTPEGKRAVMEALHQNRDKLKEIRAAEKNQTLTPTKVAAAAMNIGTQKQDTTERGSGSGHFPFTAADIAKTGAAAIDQTRYPNCWFEASMAALAELPRGQRLIASMIRTGQEKDSYVVRFPGDGHEYKITMEDLQKAKVHDSALWASLIECAQTRKFPDNAGAEGASGEMSRLEVGLGCISGCKAEVLDEIKGSSEKELSSFIGSAIKSQNPVVAGTNFAWEFPRNAPWLAIPLHAYTITGFDPAHSMITIRNPHGQNSRTFSLPSDPNHLEFEQLDDGVFKMSIRTFQKYFYSVARSYI